MTSALTDSDIDAVVAPSSLVGIDETEALRQRAVEVIAELVDTTLVGWNDVDLASGRMQAVLSRPLESLTTLSSTELGDAFIPHVAEHPVIDYYRRTGDGRPWAISDFVSAEAFHATNLYRLVYAPLRTEDQLSFVLPDPELVIGIVVHRDRRGFDARDRQVCNVMRPSLVQAYRHVGALAEVRRMLASLARLVEDHGTAAIILDGDGRAEYVTPAAADLLARYFGNSGRGPLPDEVSAAVRERRRAWLPAPALVHRSDAGRLAIRSVRAEQEVIVLSELDDEGDRAGLRRLGLSRREAEVLHLIVGGRSTKQIAATLAISVRTVDKHVGNALDKLGASTRIEAVALLSERLHAPRREVRA